MIERTLRERGDWLGAACVPRYRDLGFLLAAHVRGSTLVLSGIGGKVEPAETFRAAAVREFAEETGTEVTIRPVPRPRHLSPEATPVPVPDGAGALLARPRPDRPGSLLWIAVFAASVDAAPRPVEKVPYFALVPPAAFPVAGRAPGLDDLAVLAGAQPRPAREVLPAPVTGLDPVLTALAVLTAPGLLAEWWQATADRASP